MNLMDKDFILGMTSILNEAAIAYYDGKPIITDEQYDTRLKELKELEEEIGCMLTCSPNQKNEIKITIGNPPVTMDTCHTTDKLIKFIDIDVENLIASVVPDGITINLIYKNGILVDMKADKECYFKQFKNIPYKVNEKLTFEVRGKAIPIDETKLCFYADNINYDEEKDSGLYNNLKKAEILGFDIVPIWNATELNPKTIQSFVDFAYDYAEDDADMPCEGIAFRYDNINNKPLLRYEGIIYKKLINV